MAWTAHKVLTALPSGGECIGLDALQDATRLPRKRVINIVSALNRSGLVNQISVGCYARSRRGDAMVERGRELRSGPHAPHGKSTRRADTLRERAWRAFRALKKATIPELLEMGANGDEKAGDANVRKYLRSLEAVGIAAALASKAPGLALTSNGFVRWVLVRDLGPKAPVVRATGVFDPNAQEWVSSPGARPRGAR